MCGIGQVATERSRRISRTALSDKTSRLHPRRAAAEPGQTYEPEVPVKVREWIAPALASSALVLEPQPPAQPHSHVRVERAIRLAGGADAEVIGPPAEHAGHLVHKLCGLLPGTRPDIQLVDGFDQALDALLLRSQSQEGLARRWRVHSAEREA